MTTEQYRWCWYPTGHGMAEGVAAFGACH